jgi:hypothetical protein
VDLFRFPTVETIASRLEQSQKLTLSEGAIA